MNFRNPYPFWLRMVFLVMGLGMLLLSVYNLMESDISEAVILAAVAVALLSKLWQINHPTKK